jgi:hypothetical protein
MSTTNNFFEALKLIEQPKKVDIFFRLYYNEITGLPLYYSMEDLEGPYIEISKEEFALADFNVFIKDGKIKKKKMLSIGKLVPSNVGYQVHKDDISIIDNTSNRFWNNKTYDADD